MVLKAGDMERVMPRLALHIEEPRVGQSYPNFYVAQLASKFVKVALAGTGGDELFGGYPWRYYRAVVNDDFEHYIDKYYNFWQRLLPNTVIREFYSRFGFRSVTSCLDIFRDVFSEHARKLTRPRTTNHPRTRGKDVPARTARDRGQAPWRTAGDATLPRQRSADF
jgi:asparagine synthase (glutamine-hydrolysing)